MRNYLAPSYSSANLTRAAPGSGREADLNKAQKAGLENIRKLLAEWKRTGVQECMNRVVFDLLNYIAVFPVEDENKWTDKNGAVLPDAYLMKRGSTTRDLAYQVHSEVGADPRGSKGFCGVSMNQDDNIPPLDALKTLNVAMRNHEPNQT